MSKRQHFWKYAREKDPEFDQLIAAIRRKYRKFADNVETLTFGNDQSSFPLAIYLVVHKSKENILLILENILSFEFLRGRQKQSVVNKKCSSQQMYFRIVQSSEFLYKIVTKTLYRISLSSHVYRGQMNSSTKLYPVSFCISMFERLSWWVV